MELRLQGVVASLDSEREENSRLHAVFQEAGAQHAAALVVLQTTIEHTKQLVRCPPRRCSPTTLPCPLPAPSQVLGSVV
jgi:hypothetical protein